MMDWDQYRRDCLHKVLAGYPTSRPQLIAAGLFVAVWFTMDLIEFVDFSHSKFVEAGRQCMTVYVPLPPLALPSAPPIEMRPEGLKINRMGYIKG